MTYFVLGGTWKFNLVNQLFGFNPHWLKVPWRDEIQYNWPCSLCEIFSYNSFSLYISMISSVSLHRISWISKALTVILGLDKTDHHVRILRILLQKWLLFWLMMARVLYQMLWCHCLQMNPVNWALDILESARKR